MRWILILTLIMQMILERREPCSHWTSTTLQYPMHIQLRRNIKLAISLVILLLSCQIFDKGILENIALILLLVLNYCTFAQISKVWYIYCIIGFCIYHVICLFKVIEMSVLQLLSSVFIYEVLLRGSLWCSLGEVWCRSFHVCILFTYALLWFIYFSYVVI